MMKVYFDEKKNSALARKFAGPRKLAAVFLPLLLLAGCATNAAQYGPAPMGQYGFHNSQIEKDRFSVGFTAPNAHQARDMALLRAAELTLEQGYDRFKVIGADMSGDQNQSSPISTSIGIGIGGGHRGYHRGGSNVGIGINIHDVAKMLNGNRMTAGLEIRLLRGQGVSSDDGDQTYNARSILNALGPQVFDRPQQTAADVE